MIKQLFLPLAAVAIFITLVGIYTQKPSVLNFGKNLPTAGSQQKSLTVGSKNVQVEIANTESLREKGLGGRSSLPQDSGMFFVFDTKNVTPTFWMKDMLIPLDFIWISGSKIVKIDRKIPVPSTNTPDAKLDKIRPNQPIDYVLEVNSGFADSNNIKVGDDIDLSKI
jgi:uncharacterized membrane protein (UPF0127 family)